MQEQQNHFQLISSVSIFIRVKEFLLTFNYRDIHYFHITRNNKVQLNLDKKEITL